MLDYCKKCRRCLVIENFCYYKKNTYEDCVNKKVKCDYCGQKFDSTNISKHIKQRHTTTLDENSSLKNDSTYYGNSCQKNDSTYNEKVIDKNDRTYNEKDIDKMNTLLAKGKKLQHKIPMGTRKEKKEFTTIINKLLGLKSFDDELHDKLLSQIQ